MMTTRSSGGWFYLAAFGLLWWAAREAHATPQPVHPSVQIRHLLNASLGSKPVRLVKDPRGNTLYYLKQSGSIYRITVNPGTGTSTETRVYGSEHHTLTATLGMAIGPEGTMYVLGNTPTNNDTFTFATIVKGVVNETGERIWFVLARTEPYPLSRSTFDHLCNGILTSTDGKFIYMNSGARTDHGEVQSANGLFPNTREVALTTKIFRIPTDASNVVLANDIEVLRSAGFIFAEGVRNTYDLAFAPNGDLFGAENGPARDMSDELNWLREGQHYGFPWRMGGADNPQQFPDYDPSADRLIDPRYGSFPGVYYINDPTFPPPPTTFAEPVINLGPDADSYRDLTDGQIRDASMEGKTVSTFTAHRAPLGLVFDVEGVMIDEFRNHGFVLGFTEGDPNGYAVLGPFKDASQDLLDLGLTKLGDTNYQARVRRIVGGFSNPIDTEIIGNKIYVLEYSGSMGIWEVTIPRRLVIAGEFAPSGGFDLTVTGEIGPMITIQGSTNLATWLDLTNVVNATGTVQFTDPASAQHRFYRAVQH